MSAVLTSSTAPRKTDEGWIIDIPHGSIGVLYPSRNGISMEILPSPSPELVSSVLETCEEFREAFEKMKRLGD